MVSGTKSATAFRTISEVSSKLGIPQHVLRFWETKFNQVRPLKRGGGRRYYRPEDIALLSQIQRLLYENGYTIKGVQKLMRDGDLKQQSVLAAPETFENIGTKTDPNTAKKELRIILSELQQIQGVLDSWS